MKQQSFLFNENKTSLVILYYMPVERKKNLINALSDFHIAIYVWLNYERIVMIYDYITVRIS